MTLPTFVFLWLAIITCVAALSGCAVDYTTQQGSKFRFSLTATPQEASETLEGWAK